MSRQTDAVLRRVDEIKRLDEQIQKLKGRMSILAAKKDKLEKEGIHLLEKSGLEIVGNARWNTSVKETDVPTMEDFDKFWRYVHKNDIPELMTRAVNSKTWRERGMNVPGVGTFTRKKLSITRRR